MSYEQKGWHPACHALLLPCGLCSATGQQLCPHSIPCSHQQAPSSPMPASGTAQCWAVTVSPARENAASESKTICSDKHPAAKPGKREVSWDWEH